MKEQPTKEKKIKVVQIKFMQKHKFSAVADTEDEAVKQFEFTMRQRGIPETDYKIEEINHYEQR